MHDMHRDEDSMKLLMAHNKLHLSLFAMTPRRCHELLEDIQGTILHRLPNARCKCIRASVLRKLVFHFLSNGMGYDRGDRFPFDFEPNGLPFGEVVAICIRA